MPKLASSKKDNDNAIAIIRGGDKDGEFVYFDDSNKNDPILKVENLYDLVSDKKVRSQKKYMSLKEMLDLQVAFQTGNVKDDIKEIYDRLKPEVVKAKNNSIHINDGSFELIPTIKENQVQKLMVCGMSGSGKSTLISKYAMNYKAVFPKNRIIIISRHDEDEVLDRIKGIKRIKLTDEILDTEIDIKDLASSLVIMDDIDTIPNPKINKLIANLRDDLLENARHHNIYMCVVSHQILNAKKTKHLLLECDTIVFFPRSGAYQIKRFLKEYASLEKDTINKIIKLPSRWCALNKNTFPNTLISESDIFIL